MNSSELKWKGNEDVCVPEAIHAEHNVIIFISTKANFNSEIISYLGFSKLEIIDLQTKVYLTNKIP